MQWFWQWFCDNLAESYVIIFCDFVRNKLVTCSIHDNNFFYFSSSNGFWRSSDLSRTFTFLWIILGAFLIYSGHSWVTNEVNFEWDQLESFWMGSTGVKKWSHCDLKSWVIGGTKIRPGIPSNWRILRVKIWLLISSQFDLNIFQLLGITGRILVPPMTQLFMSKLPLFYLRAC